MTLLESLSSHLAFQSPLSPINFRMNVPVQRLVSAWPRFFWPMAVDVAAMPSHWMIQKAFTLAIEMALKYLAIKFSHLCPAKGETSLLFLPLFCSLVLVLASLICYGPAPLQWFNPASDWSITFIKFHRFLVPHHKANFLATHKDFTTLLQLLFKNFGRVALVSSRSSSPRRRHQFRTDHTVHPQFAGGFDPFWTLPLKADSQLPRKIPRYQGEVDLPGEGNNIWNIWHPKRTHRHQISNPEIPP